MTAAEACGPKDDSSYWRVVTDLQVRVNNLEQHVKKMQDSDRVNGIDKDLTSATKRICDLENEVLCALGPRAEMMSRHIYALAKQIDALRVELKAREKGA